MNVPGSGAANSVYLYAKDLSASSELYVMDEASNETLLSPHGFYLFAPDTSIEMPFSYYSKNPILGYEVNIDMAGLVKEVEALSSLAGRNNQFMYLRELPEEDKATWDEVQEQHRTKRMQEIAHWHTMRNERDVLENRLNELDLENEEDAKLAEEIETNIETMDNVLGDAPPKNYVKKPPPQYIAARTNKN